MDIITKQTEALDILLDSFFKILKINLTDNTFEFVKYTDGDFCNNQSDKLSDFINGFASDGLIFSADAEQFERRTSLQNLRRHFKKGNNSFAIRYRRLINDEYVWVFMEIYRTKDYTDDNQICMMYIKRIDESYVKEIEKSNKLEYLNNFDVLTGLYNYNSYLASCMKYTNKGLMESVGAIFADLNGLKVINDTQGHEVGNEYIKSFARILSNLFSKAQCFRISGDEFIVLFLGPEKDYFMKTEAALIKRINEDAVPIASIGCAWSESPLYIQDVVKDAERDMYKDKERFYKKFPQYKRSALEESTRREFNAVISCLASSYSVVAIIDLVEDRYNFLKSSPGNNTKALTWTDYLDVYCSTRVTSDFRDLFKKTGSIDYLKEELKTNNSVSFDYQMFDGRWMHVTYRPIDFLSTTPTKVVVFAEFLDKNLSDRLHKSVENKHELNILEGLELEYSFICIIDYSTQIMKLHKSEGLSSKIAGMVEEKTYSYAHDIFIDHFVSDEDKDIFSEHTKIEYIKQQLCDKTSYSICFESKNNLHKNETSATSQFTYFKASPEAEVIILAGRSI